MTAHDIRHNKVAPTSPLSESMGRAIEHISNRLASRHKAPGWQIRRFGLAIVLVLIATAARTLIAPEQSGLPFITYFPAVTLAAFFGGFRAGMLATILSSILATALFFPHIGVPADANLWPTVLGNLGFILDAIIVSGLIQALHQSFRRGRATQAHLEAQRQMLNSIIEGTPDIIFVKDTQGRYIHCNQSMLRTMDKTREEIIGQSAALLWPDGTAHALDQRDVNLMAKGGTESYEVTYTTPRGESLLFQTTKSLLCDKSGHIKGIIGFARDITAAKLAETQLKQSEQRFKTLSNGTFEGILISSNGRILDVNDRLIQSLGYQKSEVLGRQISDFLAPQERDKVNAVIASDAESHAEYSVQHKNGSFRIVEAHGQSIIEDGQPIRITAFHDITERRREEEELRAAKVAAEKANTAKSRFLAAASHDLRQPLSALVVYVGVLERKIQSADQQLMTSIKQCVSALSELLTDLLDLSKLEAGVVLPMPSDFSLDDILASVISSLEPKTQSRKLSLRHSRTDLFCRTDPILFQRIVMNLVSNAIRYTEQGGVLIGCRRKLGKTWLEVWDTGMGIPADKIDEIFEEFSQLGNLERNPEKGSGIGLAIVARTAALLDLKIRVHSKLGKGSVFAVELPVGKPIQAETGPPQEFRRLRIALVEDNIEVAKALTYFLSETGHEVITASSRSNILDMLGGSAPDIVISDYRLSGRDTGFDVIASLRTKFAADLPGMIITGDTDPTLMHFMATQGIHIQHKPLNLDRLQTALAELTGPHPCRMEATPCAEPDLPRAREMRETENTR